MVFQVIAVLLIIIFILVMLAHIKAAWYDFTHMDEYYKRVLNDRAVKQAKKEALVQQNKQAAKTAQSLAIAYWMMTH